MIYLIFSIFSSSLLFLIFKGFDRFKVSTENAIVFNYSIAAAISGYAALGSQSLIAIVDAPWFLNAIGLGFLFIVVFVGMGYSSILAGVSATSVASKMSLAIPVALSVLFLGDSVTTSKILGFVVAVPALILSSQAPSVDSQNKGITRYLLTLFVFAGSGTIDWLIKYNQHYYLNNSDSQTQAFNFVVFTSAFLFGIVYMVVQLVAKSSVKSIKAKDVVGGIVLGIPNVASLYFLVKSLDASGYEASVVFPLNNMGIVMVSSVLGSIIFREKPSVLNSIGFVLAILAIALITISF
jgi:uncharacterized membrane protein